MTVQWKQNSDGGYELATAFGVFYLSERYLDNSYDYAYDASFYGNPEHVGSRIFASLSETIYAENDNRAKEKAVAVFRKWIAEFSKILEM
jgi:hypothetical protein